MAKRKGKKSGSGRVPAPTREIVQAMGDWCGDCLQEDRGRVHMRIAVFVAGEHDPVYVEPLGRFDLSPALGAQVARVVSRSHPPEAVTALLVRATIDATNKVRGVPSDTGRMRQPGAAVVGASRDGRPAAVLYQPDPVQPGVYHRRQCAPGQASVPDWTAPGFRVSRYFEDLLAREGVDGALRQLARQEAASEPRPLPGPKESLLVPADCKLETTWESAFTRRGSLLAMDLRMVMPAVRVRVAEAAVPGTRSGDFAAVVDGGWNTESESLRLLDRFGPPNQYQSPDPLSDVEVVATSGRLTERVRLVLLSGAADARAQLADWEAAWQIGRRLVEVAGAPDAPEAAAAWVDRLWKRPYNKARRAEGKIGTMGTAAVCAICSVALWKILRHSSTPGGRPLLVAPSTGRDLAFAEAVLAALLDRLAVPAGTPADRVVSLAARVLGVSDARYGTVSPDRWNQALTRDLAVYRTVR